MKTRHQPLPQIQHRLSSPPPRAFGAVSAAVWRRNLSVALLLADDAAT